jgi:hypothetical protein
MRTLVTHLALSGILLTIAPAAASPPRRLLGGSRLQLVQWDLKIQKTSYAGTYDDYWYLSCIRGSRPQ